MSSGPLAGIRILDLTRLLPGGFGLSILADLGAEVIKVEQPGKGDYMRWDDPKIGDESAHNWVTDRGKRSIALNLKDPGAVEALKRLAASSDALIESYRPGVVDRLGIGYDAMRSVNPRLVYCSMTGYGQSGPSAMEPGHDLNYIGRAGILSITGIGGRPAIPGVQIADLGAGALMSLVGMLSAIVHAQRTGEGDHVDVAMTDGAFAWLSIHMGDHFATGEVPASEKMLLNGLYPCYQVYECADGRFLTVGAVEEQFWAELCSALDRPDLTARQFDPAAVAECRSLFAGRARDEWLESLAGRDVCVGPVNDFAEAAADPQLIHREMIVDLAHADGTVHRQVGSPIKLRENPAAIRAPAPPLGEGTRALLTEAGYGDAEIDALVASGAAAEPASATAL